MWGQELDQSPYVVTDLLGEENRGSTFFWISFPTLKLLHLRIKVAAEDLTERRL
jgi:hypothetical protein